MNIREILQQSYQSLTAARQTAGFEIYSGVARRGGQAVYIVLVGVGEAGAATIEACLKGYERARAANARHLLRALDVISAPGPEGGLALIYPGAGIAPLAQVVSLPLAPERFLSLAGQLTDLVRGLHEAGLTLSCLPPDLIFLAAAEDELLVADWCFQAAGLSLPEFRAALPLAYISPEQTGRMNRETDYRSDFYILGTLFYEWLAGEPLFAGAERSELLHAHIARTPPSPRDLNSTVPPLLSDLVMKLLHKSPEDRYQSAFGLKQDLERSRRWLTEQGEIPVFALAEQDTPERLDLSLNLYEREAERQRLLAGYQRASNGATLFMIVAGPSGIGKSRLVQSLYLPVTESGGLFIAGKYDALQHHTPYQALIQALGAAARWMLKQPPERIAYWRARFSAFLGENGQILIDMMPEFAAIIGAQPAIPETSPVEARNRFKLVFAQIIKALADQAHPLVLFLDDLQWADSASIDLIQSFLTEYEAAYLYVIGGYREDGDELSDAWLRLASTIPGQGASLDSVRPGPLSPAAIGRILADVLGRNPEQPGEALKIQALAEFILEKTSGNPFFIQRFLHEIYAEGLLYYDFERGVWNWDLAQIRRRNISADIVDLLCRSLDELPPDTRRALQSAACFGSVFEVETVAYIAQKSVAATLADLAPALRGQYVRIPDPTQELIMEFTHDRVRQAIYATIPELQKEACHWQIGEILLQNVAGPKTQDHFFFIVNHLNLGQNRFADREEKQRLAELNLKAGINARKATAYQSARLYFRVAADLLGADAWDQDYELSLALFPRLAECEYLCGRFDQAETLFAEILNRVADKIAKARIYGLKIDFHTHRGQVAEAVALAAEGLRLFNLELPLQPTKAGLWVQLIRAAFLLRRRKIEDIIRLPVMQDPEKLAAAALLSHAGAAAFYLNPRLFAYIILFGVNMTLKHGVTAGLALALVPFGLIVGAGLGRYELGHRLGRVALALIERLNDKEYRAKTYFAFVYFIAHWRQPVRENLHYFRIARQGALQTGDLSFVGHSINSETLYRLMAGDPLDALFAEYREAEDMIRRTREPFIQQDYRDNFRFYQNLKGLTQSRDSLDGDGYDQAARLKQLRRENNRLALFLHLLLRLKMLYLAGKYPEAGAVGDELRTLADAPQGTLHEAEYVFFYGLSLAADWSPKGGRRRHFKQALRQMKRWAAHCPANFLHKYWLLAAEMARINGQSAEALALYLKACSSAGEQGYLQNEALGHELAAKFHFSHHQRDLAVFHLKQAYRGYQRWGATAITADLKARYGHIAELAPKAAPPTLAPPDTDAVIALLQAISTEIVMEKLLKRIIQTVMEQAGADLIAFLSVKDGRCYLEAEKKADSEQIVIYDAIPADDRDDLFSAVIHYVRRTRRRLVVDDASRQQEYAADDYVKRQRPKSVLCLPVIRQTLLTAVLYLENTLAVGAFTENRIAILQWLASQFAISFENARFYEQMRKTEAELRALEDALKYRLECERLISQVSSIFLTSPPDRIPQAIDRALQALGEFVGEDRSYLFQLSPDGLYANETNEWLAPGVESKMDEFQCLRLADFPWLTEKITAFEIVHISTLAELPAVAVNLKHFLEVRGVYSFVLIPMISGNELAGFVGFEAVRQQKTRDPDQLKLLRTVSDLLAHACAGFRIETEKLMYQEQLRAMSLELSLTEERERRRIAVELHDRIGHALANCAMKLGILKEAALLPEQQSAWTGIKQLIDQSIKDTHSLTFELSPPILYDLGLEAAIDWLVEQTTAQHGLAIDFSDDMAYKPLDHGFRVLLFQAARELLFNIVKHACADQVLIEVRKAQDQIEVIIQDDGVGFNVGEKNDSAKVGGFGLFSIRERLRHQGGGFEIMTNPGQGTRIIMTAPLARESTPAEPGEAT